jgi:hypothetical protein
LQEVQQQMVSFNGLGILVTGLIIITILLVIGLRENDDIARKERFIRAAGVIFGALIIITELLWYLSVIPSTTTPMTYEDVLIITGLSSIGGLIIGISCYLPIGRE